MYINATQTYLTNHLARTGVCAHPQGGQVSWQKTAEQQSSHRQCKGAYLGAFSLSWCSTIINRPLADMWVVSTLEGLLCGLVLTQQSLCTDAAVPAAASNQSSN
jgi:hypothetical protein